MQRISIIVPCYNEHETINIFYDEVIKYINDEYDFKIVFVNDGSKDNTLELMQALAEKDKRVKYVSFSRNFGKEAAMYAGLEAAKRLDSDMAIIMDVDLQDPPRLIPDLINAHNEGYNLVYTRQKNRHGSSKKSAFFSLSFYKTYAFFTKDKGMAKGARDFCLLDRKVIDAFLSIKDQERFTKGIYHYVGFRNKCIEFEYEKRSAGETKWNFKKLLKYAFVGIREFSNFYVYIPKFFLFLSFILLIYDTTRQIINCVNQNTINVFNWHYIRIDLILIAIFITLTYLFKLVYEVRSQSRNRPIYIEEDSNIDETE